jgi:hypothetical protein
MIEISEGVFIVDVAKFLDVYNARSKEYTPLILNAGVVERMELYNAKNDTLNRQKTD